MHLVTRILAVLAALAAAVPALAGESYSTVLPPLRVGTEALIPHRGAYWDPSQPGSGYVVDLSRSSTSASGYFGFATLYTYREDGTSTFLVLQGDLELATETQRREEGWIARLSSPLFEAVSGQPFGGAHRPPTVSPSPFGSGTLTWSTRRTAELRVGDRVTPIRVVSADTAETEAAGMLSGFWVLQARIRSSATPQTAHPASERYAAHVVKLTPIAPAPTWSQGPGAPGTLPWLPPAGVITFAVTCVSECFPTGQTVTFASEASTIYHQARVWIDPQTMRASWVVNAQAAGQGTPHATQTVVGGYGTVNFDLYVDDDTVVGRGLGVYTRLGDPSLAAGVYTGAELILTRVSPAGLNAAEGRFAKIY